MAGKKLNNLSARLIVNSWLSETGERPIPATASYEEFATALRTITAKTVVPACFASRADAVAYIRHTACGILAAKKREAAQ